MLAFIPSPHTGTVSIGPLTLHMYGLTLLVAILACVWLTGKRWVAQGGEWELVTRVAVWGVAFGVIGARLYHDVTSWNEVPTPKWQGMFEVWKGGLGVWGGIGLGVIVGAIVVRRSGANVSLFMDAVAPGAAARAGNRPDRQLVEPGAVRQADRPLLGAQDRPRTPARPVLRPGHLPPDLPLRADLGLRSASQSCSTSAAASGSGRRRCSRSTSPGTRSAASSRSCCGSTRPTTSPGCA